MQKNFYISFLFLILAFFVGFFLIHNNRYFVSSPSPEGRVGEGLNNIKYVEIAGQKVKVDLALTETEQIQGLSGRQSLSPNTGMLFVFNKPGNYPFWMPNMNFSIDIIWITPDMKVDYIKKDATPESYPVTFSPKDNNATYVLEVPSGFSEQNHLQIGDSVGFTY